MYVLALEYGLRTTELMHCRFIEENNAYRNEQKDIQRSQRMPPGMPSQELMMYWGMLAVPFLFPLMAKCSRLQIRGLVRITTVVGRNTP